MRFVRVITCALAVTCVALAACAPSSSDPDGSEMSGCATDGPCAMGEECVGGACVTSPPTLYSHIQLASPLLRVHNDDNEVTWRAANGDLMLGVAIVHADLMRSVNPNARIYEYFTNRYHVYEPDATDWAQARALNPEDFYLHYREDMFLPAYSGVELVPGFGLGVVPGWNPNPAPGDPPASATARWQSRAIGITISGEPWPMANLANRRYRQYLIDRATRMLDGTLWGTTPSQPVDGVIVDNAVYYPEFNEGYIDKTNEFYGVALDYNHPYGEAHEQFYYELRDALRSRFSNGMDIIANYGHVLFLRRPDRFSQSIQDITTWAWGEVWVSYRGTYSPTSGANRVITYNKDYQPAIADIVRQTREGGRRILGARDLVGGGSGSDRGRLYTLALYYLVHNKNTYYSYSSENGYLSTVDVSVWQSNPAVAADIGHPAPVPNGYVDFEGNAGTTEHFELATGADPVDSSLTYHVLARMFTNGMVVAKMLPEGSYVTALSATTHALPEPYVVVQADGTLGATITSITLKNNEGFILVKP